MKKAIEWMTERAQLELARLEVIASHCSEDDRQRTASINTILAWVDEILEPRLEALEKSQEKSKYTDWPFLSGTY